MLISPAYEQIRLSRLVVKLFEAFFHQQKLYERMVRTRGGGQCPTAAPGEQSGLVNAFGRNWRTDQITFRIHQSLREVMFNAMLCTAHRSLHSLPTLPSAEVVLNGDHKGITSALCPKSKLSAEGRKQPRTLTSHRG